MSSFFTHDKIFEFIHSSGAVHEILGVGFVDRISEFGVSPADNVPADGRSYMAFVGRTAKNPADLLSKTVASLLVVDANLEVPLGLKSCVVRVDNARLFFCELLSFVEEARSTVVSDSVSIHPTAVIGKECIIGDFVSIAEGVSVGDRCIIGSNVTLLKGVRIGERVNIAPGVVIGADGFGYERRVDGSLIKFPHLGGVSIGSDVDIGGNTVIDRGTLGDTVIENGVKIDNLVHISHNVRVGAGSVIIANAMIAGGVKLGQRTWVGPSSNVLDQISIGSKSFVGMGVSVVKDLPENSRFTLKNFLRLFS